MNANGRERGKGNGARSLVMFWPGHDVVIALLANLTGTPLLVEQTAEVLAGAWIENDKASNCEEIHSFN